MSPSSLVHRITVRNPIVSLAAYVSARGGRGLEIARALDPSEIVAIVTESGLRGRGGAGFPTGRKWETVLAYRSESLPATVVVNGAEGEPGTIKDRHILTTNPYQVLEGALIAARAVSATDVVIGIKQKETATLVAVRAAISEVVAAGWADGVSIHVCEGPDEYLFGEETALLEVIDGRLPFPRIAPPWRRGVIEVTEGGEDANPASNVSSRVEMAGSSDAPPALVNNVETMANVAHILARGADWFRTEGTAESPGTFVCTVTGDTVVAGVGELIAGTTVRDAIEWIGGGCAPGRSVKAVLAGVSNKVITAELLDTPITYEDMRSLGVGPGSAGFIVFDDRADMVGVAAGVARFLATESCGQCTPCKQDGEAIAVSLGSLAANRALTEDVNLVDRRLQTVATGARCFLASQQQVAVGSIVDAFPDEFIAHLGKSVDAVTPALIVELLAVSEAGATWDDRHRAKQPDWSFDTDWNGQSPADRFRDQLAASPVEV